MLDETQDLEPQPRNGAVTALPKPVQRDGSVVAVNREDPRFDSVSRLGEGGMGVVELARDNDIGRMVAVKHLKHTHDAQHVLRFAREARCLGQLEHPGIVPVHDVGRNADGSYFLVMKHLEGETLETLIRQLQKGDPDAHAKLPMHERVRICENVLHIMEYAHDRGVIHRDLKPSNIMIGEHGEVTILDWGLAKRTDGSDLEFELEERSELPPDDGETRIVFGTDAEALLGTPLYMSPEQASGDRSAVGPRSDIYGMAVVFHELLSLEHYLVGKEDISDIVEGVLNLAPKLAYWIDSPHQDRVPIELAYWLRKAMSKDALERFQSAAEMRSELQRAVDGRFDVVCPTTFSRRVFKFGMNTANKRPVFMLLLVLFVAVFAAYGAWQAISSWL